MQPEQIEIEAGISRFDQFAEFNTIYALANGDATKFDAVFNLPYSVAFLTLARKVEEAKFNKMINKLMRNK